jgi:hypothetical protein
VYETGAQQLQRLLLENHMEVRIILHRVALFSLFYIVLPCFALFCIVLPCFALFCIVFNILLKIAHAVPRLSLLLLLVLPFAFPMILPTIRSFQALVKLFLSRF